MLGKQNPSKYWTEYIPSVHYSLGLIPTSAKRRKEKGGMKTKELRDGGRGEANWKIIYPKGFLRYRFKKSYINPRQGSVGLEIASQEQKGSWDLEQIPTVAPGSWGYCFLIGLLAVGICQRSQGLDSHDCCVVLLPALSVNKGSLWGRRFCLEGCSPTVSEALGFIPQNHNSNSTVV